MKKLYGLIGYPVKHSLSAIMHNAAFTALGIDAVYELFEVAVPQLDSFFKATVREKALAGCNVTIPHKETALKYVTAEIPEEVSIIGATNTLKFEGDGSKIHCTNTDGAGFLRHLRELHFSASGKVISILGAGGAARAASLTLAKQKPRAILLYDIDAPKSQQLAATIKKYYSGVEVISAGSVEELQIRNADLLINATPIGMKTTDPCLVDSGPLHSRLLVYDLIYNPRETELLNRAKKQGAATANGLKMLLYQGILSFEYWTAKAAPEEVMWKALNSHTSTIQ